MDNYQPINPNYPHILHGGDYNPEQWMEYEGIWDEDMRLMKLANCNTMTVGIFSWAVLEPEEGRFCFDFLDEISPCHAKRRTAGLAERKIFGGTAYR